MNQPAINLYFCNPPEQDRWVRGDKYVIPILRTLVRGRKINGIEKVFTNLCKGFNLLDVNYTVNKPFKNIKDDEPVVVLGNGSEILQGYKQPNPIIAGIGLMTHPAQWPTLFQDYPVATYLQHSAWVNNIYTPYYGTKNCELWAAGIDTEKWQLKRVAKKYDFLVYDKIMWNKTFTRAHLILPILKKLEASGSSYQMITYGQYKEAEYYNLLQQSRAMIFLCEHESQGFACCEALSMDVPVLAYDQGFWLDPDRFLWNEKHPVPATSVPYFDFRCGEKFTDIDDFHAVFDTFFAKMKEGKYTPRSYILENITLKKSAQRMLEIVGKIYK